MKELFRLVQAEDSSTMGLLNSATWLALAGVAATMTEVSLGVIEASFSPTRSFMTTFLVPCGVSQLAVKRFSAFVSSVEPGVYGVPSA